MDFLVPFFFWAFLAPGRSVLLPGLCLVDGEPPHQGGIPLRGSKEETWAANS